jgi:hypothetical protein
MTSSNALDPHDELEALVREAMSLSSLSAQSEPAEASLSQPATSSRGNVKPLFHRSPAAAWQGCSRKRH